MNNLGTSIPFPPSTSFNHLRLPLVDGWTFQRSLNHHKCPIQQALKSSSMMQAMQPTSMTAAPLRALMPMLGIVMRRLLTNRSFEGLVACSGGFLWQGEKPGMEVSQTRETWNCGSRECFPFQKKASALSMAGGEAKHPTISWSWNWTDQLRGICLWNWPEIVRILLLHQVHHPLRSWSWLVVLVGLFKKTKESALGTRPRFSASDCVWYAACSAIPIQQYSASCSTPRCNMQQTPVPKAPHFHFKCTLVKLLAGQLGYLLKTCISRSFCTDEGCCFFLPQSL